LKVNYEDLKKFLLREQNGALVQNMQLNNALNKGQKKLISSSQN